MIHAKVFVKKVVSADGKSIAEAKSIAIASGDGETIINQSVTVEISSGSSYSSSHSSSVSSASSSQ